MTEDESKWLDQVVNVHIHRTQRKVTVGFMNAVPLLEREYVVFEYLARENDPARSQSLNEIARKAFPKTELVTVSSIYQILLQIKRTLVSCGAYRGFLRMPTPTTVQLYAPSSSVKVTAFHDPTARHESGPADGSVSPAPDLVEPVWEGQVSEKADGQICQEVYQYLNQDDRPNGRFAPSLSVGDIVTLAGGGIEAVSYQAATGMGWIRLKTPVHADPDAIEAMKAQLKGRPYTVALNT